MVVWGILVIFLMMFCLAIDLYEGVIVLILLFALIVISDEPVKKELQGNKPTIEQQVDDKSVKAKYCSNCGKALEEEDKFCSNCGEQVK